MLMYTFIYEYHYVKNMNILEQSTSAVVIDYLGKVIVSCQNANLHDHNYLLVWTWLLVLQFVCSDFYKISVYMRALYL